MSVTIDTANFYNTSSNSVTTSFTTGNATVGAGDNLLVVFLEAYIAGSNNPFTSLTWGGTSLTRLGYVENNLVNGVLEIWYLANPTAGTNTFTATYPSALQGFSALSSVPLSGANVTSLPTSAFGTIASAFSGSVGSPLNVTASGGNATGIYLGCGQMNRTSISSTGTGQTSLGTVSGIIMSTDWIAGTGSGAFTWTGTGGSNTNNMGVAVAVFGSAASFPNPILNPTSISLSGVTTSTWTTLASGAPSGATGMAYLLSVGAGSFVRETRKNGSTDAYISDACGSSDNLLRFCGLDGSGNFQYYTTNTTPTNDAIYPLIWFGGEATFPTNIIAMGSTLTGSYTTYSTGGNAPGALAAVFNIHGGSDYASFFRHPSSSDDFANANEAATRRDWLTALNAGQQYAAKAGNTGRQPYLVCYFTSNYVTPSNFNSVVRTPGTAGSYQNLSTSGDNSPLAIVYYLDSPSTSYTFQLSGQTSAWTAPTAPPGGNFASQQLAIAPAQANIQNVALAIYEQGYFTLLATSPNQPLPFSNTQFFVQDRVIQY